MKWSCLILIFANFSVMHEVICLAQNADVASEGGTIRGHIEDTTAQRNPIEGVVVIVKDVSGDELTTTTDEHGEYEITNLRTGRYFVSIYKDGYGDRVGKPVMVVAGGDRYFPLKMTKKDNIDMLSQKMGFVFWPLALLTIVALTLILLIVVRRLSRSDSVE
ncbi:MAG: carboxypeptidase-like regulatory domain-containing protein [Candidatus Poribacteria bacterium]|nr:carboxypeptidase-like regulatory domain-containing protein [Candidatus Poribacteria bacterium]MDE0504823.1 carboxypeptidase-like regulatory domain-containing protein [Candidatus Poribacteria bacterium]